MAETELISLIGQLGASGIFAAAIVVLAKTFYQHYEDEIKYLRSKVDELEKQLVAIRAVQEQVRLDARATPNAPQAG